jgi:hypothetical protein
MSLAAGAAYAEPAAVISGKGCGVPHPDLGIVFTTDVLNVTTQSNNGNAVLKCKVKTEPPLSGKAWVDSGFLCGIAAEFGGFRLTNESHATVSAKGITTLTCRDRLD